jgi:hypothetical protein
MSLNRPAIEAAEHSRSMLARYAGWGLIGVTLVYYLTYFNYGIDLDDEGFLLLNAASVLNGQWPIADFFSYGPLSYVLLASFFKVLGNTVLTERIMLMTLLLLNVCLLYYCAKKLLPLSWAWIAPAVYAFAPGPWYKVFFITHLLVCLAALIYFLERPGTVPASLLGFTTGLAAIGRLEAGAEIAVVVGAFLIVQVWRGDYPDPLGSGFVRARLRAFCRIEAAFLLGMLVPIGVTLAAYAGVGKFLVLLHNIERYYNPQADARYLETVPGLVSAFSLARLFADRSLELWVYAVALLACVLNLARYSWAALARGAPASRTFVGLAVALFGLVSMEYTYYFVWNSRMLSSFAIVYINYLDLCSSAYQRFTGPGRGAAVKAAVATVGILAIIFYLKSFIVVQNYSGSYSTHVRGAMATVDDVPVLKGIHPYADQVGDITKMRGLLAGTPHSSRLVSMSEATTMGYISGLPNPTYYRLFLVEFAPSGERERAIRAFERCRIRYFVARRSQFLSGGNHSSDLGAYAPEIKAYLLEKYRVIPLGNNFVLLEREVGR